MHVNLYRSLSTIVDHGIDHCIDILMFTTINALIIPFLVIPLLLELLLVLLKDKTISEKNNELLKHGT